MDKIIEKISSYNIINNILPGVTFIFLLKEFFKISFTSYGVIPDFIIYYFVGSVLSRLGSLIVEPILLKIKIIQYAPYSQFIEASKQDDKINTLMETTNFYRTMVAVFLLLILIGLLKLFKSYIPVFFITHKILFVLLALVLLYIFSFRKQIEYVKKRIIKITGGQNNG